MKSGADEVIVAADTKEICDAVEAVGGKTRLTDPNHESGTDRIAEVAVREKWTDDTVVVNLQGDEPFVDPDHISLCAKSLLSGIADMATLATPIRDPSPVFDPNVVKVVFDSNYLALYFSRAPIPWVRGLFQDGQQQKALPPNVPFWAHVGMYAYRTKTLRKLTAEHASRLESAEKLEQLRALSCGIKIAVATVEHSAPGVDTEEDLRRALRI